MHSSTLLTTLSLAALTTAAALPSAFPTLGGPAWYDWTTTATADASSASVIADTESQTAWGQWTPAEATATNTWGEWVASTSVPALAEVTSASASASSATASESSGSGSGSGSSVPYSNPFTIYTTMTNSLGVITGMPSVVTSQPSVVTSQPSVVTTQAVVVSSNGSEGLTTMTMTTTTMTSGSSASGSASGSGSGSMVTISRTSSQGFTQTSPAVQHTGAASHIKASGMGFAVVVLGWGVAML